MRGQIVKLFNCPFCNQDDVMPVVLNTSYVQISCAGCGARGPVVHCTDIPEDIPVNDPTVEIHYARVYPAIRAWNAYFETIRKMVLTSDEQAIINEAEPPC